MPKVVDHVERRNEIVEAVWSVIARQGIAGLTMRGLATELGMANGALARYFPGKAAILRAALDRANCATDARAESSIGNRKGLDALRRLCLEIMPLDDVRLDEARVVIGFWGYAAPIPELASVFDSAMQIWRDQMAGYLHQSIADGVLPHGLAVDATVDTLMATLMGLQINAVFSAADATPARQISVLDRLLDDLRNTTRGTPL